MAKIQRQTQKIFGQNAGSRQITAFGTAKNETPEYTTDITQIQNTNFLQGWSSALLPDKAPYQEDMNALFYAITTQLAYILQQGFPEYDNNTEYSIGSVVKHIDNQGNITVYKSLVDENIGNSLTDDNYWRVYISDSTTGIAMYEIGLPQPTLSNNLLSNEIWLEGQEVSRTTYANLFAIYGTTYGQGNGTSTFNLPNFHSRVMVGSNSFGYQTASNPNVVIPNTGWSITGGHPGRVTKGTLVAGSGESERAETLESLSPTNSGIIASISGQFMPSAVKVRFKTRFQ